MTALPIPGYPDYTLTMSGTVRRNGKLVPDLSGPYRACPDGDPVEGRETEDVHVT